MGLLCSSSQTLRGDDITYGTFAGKLEGREITLQASRHYRSQAVDGFALESASKKISLVWGEEQSNGEWVLTEFPDPEHTSGTIRGRPGLQEFDGRWQAHSGGPDVPIRLTRIDVNPGFTLSEEVQMQAEHFAEQAFQAAVGGDFRQALYYLRLYRVTDRHTPYTPYWEELFEAKYRDAADAFYERARSSQPASSDFTGLQDPLAYLLAERGDIANAKRIYRSQCRTHPYSLSPLAFTCLMYASLSEKAGDGNGMREGYDFACDQLPFACRKAFGAAEERLIDAISRGDSATALDVLRQPGLNVNAKHGKALEAAVAGQLADLVKELLARGADPNADSRIMGAAVLGKDPEIPRLLLAHGADPPGKEYQAATCPQEPALEVSPASEHWLEGSIGRKRVRMYLERGGEAVVGAFYDVADWVPLILRGRWTGNGAVEVTATTEDGLETGHLKGRVSTAGFEGIWTPKDQTSGQAIRLLTSRQPSCEGKEPWRRFAGVRWPITFSYPASWRVAAGDGVLTLTCPDPSLMVYEGFDIRVTQGNAAGDEDPDYFSKSGKQWVYGDFCADGEPGHCAAAEVVRREGMTILHGDDREWRIYCRGGGYIAQGYGHLGAVLGGQRWLALLGFGQPSDLIQRILGTARRRP